MNCGPKIWYIPLRHWKIPLKEGNLGANSNFPENVPLKEIPLKEIPLIESSLYTLSGGCTQCLE
jgi:hypothetical protein